MPVPTRLAVEGARAGILSWSPCRTNWRPEPADANAWNRGTGFLFAALTQGR